MAMMVGAEYPALMLSKTEARLILRMMGAAELTYNFDREQYSAFNRTDPAALHLVADLQAMARGAV
jgi:hypothetical protein